MYVHICIETHTLSYECSLSVLIRVCSCCSGLTSCLNEDEEQIYFKQKRPRIQKCSDYQYPESYAATSGRLTAFIIVA